MTSEVASGERLAHVLSKGRSRAGVYKHRMLLIEDLQLPTVRR